MRNISFSYVQYIVQAMMVNNSTNKGEGNEKPHLTSDHWTQKTPKTYNVGNPGLSLGQA